MLLAAQQSGFALHSGDRVVFYGDSITAQRLYTRFVEDFVITRYPGLRVRFYNGGVSGDTVLGGHAGEMEVRVKRDVVPWHPTVVTIMLGMNDGHYTTEFAPSFKTYTEGYRKLIDNLRQAVPGVRLFLICPSPYDEIGHPAAISGYNYIMLRYGQFVRELGREEHIPVIDFNEPMKSAVAAGMKIDPAIAGHLQPDRIHPSPAGHWIMAAALAKGWNMDPVVSSVTLDGASGAVRATHNTKISAAKAAADELSWTELDSSLPLPLELNDPVVHFILSASATLASMDRQILRVTGLSGAAYTLRIDGQEIGSFTPEELNHGINLAVLQTPMESAARPVDWTAEDLTRIGGARFDLLTDKGDIANRQQALAALDSLAEHLSAQQYKDAQPKPHTFVLEVEK